MAEPHHRGLSSTAATSAKPEALPCLTLPAFSDACGLINSRYSCLVLKTHRRHLALSPKYLHKKRSGIQAHLSAELLKYNVALEGVPVAFDNIKLVGELGDIHDDVGYIHVSIEADFVIFQPTCGNRLVGVVNKKAPSHIGCLVHGCFNASIPRPFKIPADVWQHIAVTIGDQLEFEVFRLDSDAAGVFFVRGRLDKKLEAEMLKKMEEVSEEQNANVPEDAEQNGSEIAAGETTVLSGGSSKKKRKCPIEETHSQDECRENQEDINWNTEEAPKKKRKKHRHLEALFQNQSVEVDGSGDNSAMETSSDYREALQNTDHDAAVDNDADGLDMSVISSGQERKAKKSKKKKHKECPDLESSFYNGVTEDSLIAGDCTLEELETEPRTTKKKHKKTSLILDQDPANDFASTSLVETPTDNFGIHRETPKVKKHKKKHKDS